MSYHHNLPALIRSLRRETEGSNIYLLENSAIQLGGFTFLGCTLWTDFAVGHDPYKAMAKAEKLVNDYRLIHLAAPNRPLRARGTVEIHRESVAWLKREMARQDPARTIVVTHHGPSPRSEAPGYANGLLSPSFISDLSIPVEQSRIPLWIHGHTHFNADYRLGETRVLTNQRGYPQGTSVGFDPGMVIEV
jgi:hypothetical protein